MPFTPPWYYIQGIGALLALGERTNQNSEIMALIGQHSASLRVLRALVFSPALVASPTLVT